MVGKSIPNRLCNMCILYLHHQQQRVENDQHHDEIFKWCGHNDSPNFIFETIPLTGHVALQWPSTNSEINTGFL